MRDIEMFYCHDCRAVRPCRRRVAKANGFALEYVGPYYTCEDCQYWISCDTCNKIVSEYPHHCSEMETT